MLNEWQNVILLPKLSRANGVYEYASHSVKATSLSKVYWQGDRNHIKCPVVASRVVLTAHHSVVFSTKHLRSSGTRADVLHMKSSDAVDAFKEASSVSIRPIAELSAEAWNPKKDRMAGLKYPSSNEEIETPYEDDNIEVDAFDILHDGIHVFSADGMEQQI